jgi:hypothetical protein
MKSRIYILIIVLSLITAAGYSQEMSRKQQKDEQKLENLKQMEMLMYSKEFVFIPRIALPSGMRSVNLSTRDNYLKFHPDLIDSYMPFFGEAYSGVGYNSENGLSFMGKPEKFNIEKKGNTYQIEILVKGKNDLFRINGTTGIEGNASFAISSNNRSTITYQGVISAPEKQK